MFFSAELDSAPSSVVRALLSYSLIVFWLLWRGKRILKDAIKRPRNILVSQYPTALGKWISGIRYLLSAPDIILKSYTAGVPYAVPTPEDYYIHVSSEAHIEELSTAPENQLSLHAIAKDMLQPKYTMNGFEVHDQMTANGSTHLRVLRVLLRSNLQSLQPVLQTAIAATFSKEFLFKRRDEKGWISIPTFSMAKSVVTSANSLVFFGEQLSKNPEFLEAVLQYPEDVFVASELIRFMPKLLAPTIASIMTRQGHASKTFVRLLTPMVEDRLKSQLRDGPGQSKRLDCVQWIIDSNPRKEQWTADKIVQVIMGLWFASVHQPAMSLVYALYDLCRFPEYIEPLRAELDKNSQSTDPRLDIESLPLLDSFLKESARLSPSDSISIRRKALVPYTFSDGTHVPAGNVICVPFRAIMRDEANYGDATLFQGFRFVDAAGTANTSKFTDGDAKFPLWGLGKRACPGRYYASFALKLILAHILAHYDFELADGAEAGAQSFSWRSATVPRSGTALRFRERGL